MLQQFLHVRALDWVITLKVSSEAGPYSERAEHILVGMQLGRLMLKMIPLGHNGVFVQAMFPQHMPLTVAVQLA